MALLSDCIKCGKSVSHRAGEMPYCDDCSGRNAAIVAEKKRWDNLTVDQKLDELKHRLDSLANQSRWDGRIG